MGTDEWWMWMVAYLLVGAVFLFGIWQYVTLPNNTGLLKDKRLDTAGLWNKIFRRDLIHKERLIIGLTYLKIIVSSLRIKSLQHIPQNCDCSDNLTRRLWVVSCRFERLSKYDDISVHHTTG